MPPTRQARRKAFTVTVVTSLLGRYFVVCVDILVLGYWYGFFDYEIKRVTSVAELSPEQLRGIDFHTSFDSYRQR